MNSEGVLFKIISLILVLYVHNAVSSRTTRSSPRFITYALPEAREFKKSLGFMEDTYLNFTELVTKYNYPSEEHKVVTEDGFILTVFRILSKCPETKEAVILMHGLYDSSDLWIVTGPSSGLGYLLADSCYDVWAANHRGNTYSRKHISMNPDSDPEFWDYTFDEHGNYDVPAVIDYVLMTTQRQKVGYIGHSQGTTNFFVMGSLRPEYNDKIKVSIHLAPVAWMKHISSFPAKLIAPISGHIRKLLEDLGFREVFAKRQLVHSVLEFLCQYAPDEICGLGYTLGTGYRRGYISSRNLAVSFGHLLAGVSVKDLDHFGQLIAFGRFQRYDEGRAGNLRRYGTTKPPQYDVSKITSPVVLICAQNDGVSSLQDIDILRSKLPNVVERYVVPDKYWSHNDQVVGNDAPKYVFSQIMKHLNSLDLR